jgi:phage terminase large subunit-like protein
VPDLDDRARAELERERRALATIQYEAESFEDFVYRMSPMYRPVPPHLRPLYDLIERSRHEQVNAIISYPPRHGKALDSFTKLLTPSGWRCHGDLRIGDEVFSPDGSTSKVTYISPDVPIDYRILFDDGSTVDANGGHLWSVLRGGYRTEEIIDTSGMLACGIRVRSGDDPPRPKFSVRYTAPLSGRAAQLSIEPWLFGYWLGNGTAGQPLVTAGPADASHIEAEIQRRGHEIWNIYTHGTTKCRGFVVARNDLLKSYTKRIPVEFMVAALDQRRALVAGLVDSDGSVDPKTGRVRYVTTLPDLAEDVMRLVSTLGYRVSITKQAPHTGFAMGREVIGRLDVYTVQWTPHDGVPPGTLPRKRFTKIGIRRRRSIVGIDRLEKPGIGQCIQVDHPSHLYLVGERMVPTHNTETVTHALAWRTMVDPAVQNIYATYNHGHAEEYSAKARAIAISAGVRVGGITAGDTRGAGSTRVVNWKTSMGGGLLATSVGGGVTGKPCHGLAVLDDTIKGAEAAASIGERERVWRWLKSDVLSRIEGGGSVFIVGTRFHGDDPAGRILNGGPDWAKGIGRDWVVINVPAVGDEFGNPIDEREHPELARPCWTSINARYPNNVQAAMDWYRVKRAAGEYEWWSLYQGTPRSEGQILFPHDDIKGMPRRSCMPIKLQGKRAMIMLDPAATGNTRSDHNALGVFAMSGYGDETIMVENKWGEAVEAINPNPSVMDVVEVFKAKIPVPDAVEEAYRWQKRYNLRVGVEVDGTGANLPDWIKRLKPQLKITAVRTGGKSKYTRALPASKMWKSGRILVPDADDEGRILDEHGQPYRTKDGGYVTWQCPPREYLRVLAAFTGMGDPEDDVVDVTTHAVNRLYKPWVGGMTQVRAPAY